MIFFLQLCVLKGCFQYNDAKPTDGTPYKPGQPGAEWSSDEIDIVREKVGKARFFLETNFFNDLHAKSRRCFRMEGALTLIFGKSETNRDIKK